MSLPKIPLVCTIPSRLLPRQARTPSKLVVLLPSSPPPAAHHRIALPRASTPSKPPLNCNTGRPLSFAPFHMFITLFVVEFYSSERRPSPPRPASPSEPPSGSSLPL